jgi:DNA-binding MarR family transcriptional regulator
LSRKTPSIDKALKDEIRLTIYIYLTVHHESTLKELSDFLHRAKTTVHHHIKILEDLGIIKWREEDSDKKLKKRYYSLNGDSQELSDKDSVFKNIIEWGLINDDLLSWMINWMINYTKDQYEIIDQMSLKESRGSFIRTFTLTDETLPIYEKFEKKMLEAMNKRKIERESGEEVSPITHVSTRVFVPIKDILEWKRKSSRE